jgi:hypothetical protein
MAKLERLASYLRMIEALDETINAEALEARCYNHTPITVKPFAVGTRKAVLKLTIDLWQTEGKFLNCITDLVFNLGGQRVVLPFSFDVTKLRTLAHYQPPTTFLVEVPLWPRHLKQK